MNVAVLASASAIMLVHAACASLSLATGTLVLICAKGTPRHVLLGRSFVAAMIVTALTSFAIASVWPGHFSPIHILSVVTLTTLPLAIWQRRRGNIAAHARTMALNYTGLVVAGALSFVPPRLLGIVVFGA